MPYAQGMSQSIHIWPEDTVKTLPGTVNADKLSVIDPRFRPVRNTSTNQAQTGSAEPRFTILGKRAFEWSFGLDCNPSSMAPMLYLLTGNREQQGTSALYHTRFRLGTLPSFGAQDGHSGISRYFPFLGGYCGQGDFSMSTEGAMSANFSGMGYTASTPVTSSVVNGTTTDRTTLQTFSYLYGRVKIDGVKVGYIKAGTLALNRALARDAAIDETDEAAVIFSEIATVGGNLTALVDADAVDDLYTPSLSSTDIALEFFVPYGSGSGFWIVIPNAKLLPASVVPAGTGLNTLEASYAAQPGSTKGSARSKFFSDETLSTLTLVIKVDGAAGQTVTFGAGDNTPEEAVIAINAGTTGCVARVERKAGETGGVVIIESDTTGSSSSIQIDATSTADVTLGFDNTAHAGGSGISVEFWLANTVAV